MLYVLLAYLLSPIVYLWLWLRKRNDFKKILVVQTAKIGDMICTTPIFREIKKKYSSAHVTVLINPITEGLLENNPYIDEIITIRHSDVKGFAGKMRLSGLIRKGRYNIAVCLNPNIPYAVALFWGMVPIRVTLLPDYVGGSFSLASHLFTHLEKHIQGRMVIETYMEMLKNIGIKSNNILKEVYQSEASKEKVKEILGSIEKTLIGIGVSSGNKMKALGLDEIVQLIDKLLAGSDGCVVLVGSAQDMNFADDILNEVSRKGCVINTTGILTLAELPAMIERLSLFIGVDSGITYMADALKIPLIDIAGPSDMLDQRPVGDDAVIVQKKLECVPCSHTFKAPYACHRGDRACVTSVSAEEIFEVAQKMLSGEK